MNTNNNTYTGTTAQAQYKQEFAARTADLIRLGLLPSKEQLQQQREEALIDSMLRRHYRSGSV